MTLGASVIEMGGSNGGFCQRSQDLYRSESIPRSIERMRLDDEFLRNVTYTYTCVYLLLVVDSRCSVKTTTQRVTHANLLGLRITYNDARTSFPVAKAQFSTIAVAPSLRKSAISVAVVMLEHEHQ